jgi:hypothetical protein
MKKLSLVLGAAAIALAASSSAEAGFQVVRWNITGMCQIYNTNLPLPNFPPDNRRVSPVFGTYAAADRARIRLIRRGVCW